MIPKVIHYCWFGGNPKNKLIEKCIASWEKYCPDYKIIEWTEYNYKTDNVYFNQALEAKKWPFAADYARLDIIYQNGGVYLDTDVELVKPLDNLMTNSCYVGTELAVGGAKINTGLGFGAEPRNKMVKAMLEEYTGIYFLTDEKNFDQTPCPERNTKAFEKYGYVRKNAIQLVGGASVLPIEYLSPKNYLTREVNITSNTISIHHYDGAWMPGKSKLNLRVKEILGSQINRFIYRLRGIKIE